MSEENIRTGYQCAVHLAAYEGQLAWSALASFGPLMVLLLAGTIVEAFPFVTDPRVVAALNVFSAALGVGASLAWGLATLRSRALHRYWIASARELERQMPGLKTLSRGFDISMGEKRTVDGEKFVLTWLERVRHTASFSMFYIATFTVFVFALVLTIMKVGAAGN
jgi:hypothetical protein